MKDKLKIAMLGHKRIPSREGGIEIVVEELSTRMVEAGHSVTCYNRSGHHVSALLCVAVMKMTRMLCAGASQSRTSVRAGRCPVSLFRNWSIKKWAGTASADTRCWATGFLSRGKLCTFLICLYLRFSMSLRSVRKVLPRIQHRKQSLRIPERDFTRMILQVLLACQWKSI